MNLTLFLGAGFSAAFGHPVMDTFLGFADSCTRLTDDDRSFLGRLVLEARRANSFLESSPTNLEDILSFSQMGERLGLAKDSVNRNQHLLEIVQKIYTTSPRAHDYWIRYKTLKKLIGTEPKEFKDSLSFITTNYDMNIESACLSLGTQVNPGFVLQRINHVDVHIVEYFYEPNGIPLYKLHGSVNWYPSNNKLGLIVEDQVVAVRSFAGQETKSLPYPCVNDYKSPGIPVIIPPSFLKPDLQQELKEVWSGAAQALSKANVVAFIGYSFPPSDTEMMFFLARALSENASLRAVYLVDPKADNIADRLRGSNSRMGSHFRNLLHPITSDWTEVALPL